MSHKRKFEGGDPEEENKRKRLKSEADNEARVAEQVKRVQANCAEWARLLPLFVGRPLPATRIIFDPFESDGPIESADVEIMLTGPGQDMFRASRPISSTVTCVLGRLGWLHLVSESLQKATLLVDVPQMLFQYPAGWLHSFPYFPDDAHEAECLLSVIGLDERIRLRLETLVDLEKRLLVLERLLRESSPLAWCAGVIRLVVAYA